MPGLSTGPQATASSAAPFAAPLADPVDRDLAVLRRSLVVTGAVDAAFFASCRAWFNHLAADVTKRGSSKNSGIGDGGDGERGGDGGARVCAATLVALEANLLELQRRSKRSGSAGLTGGTALSSASGGAVGGAAGTSQGGGWEVNEAMEAATPPRATASTASEPRPTAGRPIVKPRPTRSELIRAEQKANERSEREKVQKPTKVRQTAERCRIPVSGLVQAKARKGACIS